jgi:hypothetical protein
MIRIAAMMRRHALLGWAMCLPIIFFFWLWASDREPPFEVISVAPVSARVGDPVTLRATVRRDSRRDCEARFSRYLYDSQFVRFDLEGEQRATDRMIDAIERRTPGQLMLSFIVPAGMSTGPAVLQTELQYRCNPVHMIAPISVTTQMPFTVLEKND